MRGLADDVTQITDPWRRAQPEQAPNFLENL